MSTVLVFVRLSLAVVFGLSAITKLADPKGFRKAITEFGLPSFVAGPFNLLLPATELFVALLLIVPTSALWGAVGALALLAVFTIGIVVNLAQGRAPDCHCFGQWMPAPIGVKTLLRNVAFAACAGLLVWKNNVGSDLSVMQSTNPSIHTLFGGGILSLLLLVAVAVQAWLMLHLFRQQGRMLRRIDDIETSLRNSGMPLVSHEPEIEKGLPIGFSAPSFELPDLLGRKTSLAHLRELGHPVLLVFSEPHCQACNALLPNLARWEQEYAGNLTLVLISTGSADDNRAAFAHGDVSNVLLQRNREVAAQYLVHVTPSAVLVNTNGSIGSSLVMGPQAVANLVEHSAQNTAYVSELSRWGHTNRRIQIGQPAPSFRLLDINGKIVQLNDFKGYNVLLVFWNPSCGFCQKMLPDLRDLEEKKHNMSLEIVVVSTGPIESNRAMQIKSVVLLDGSFSVGMLFGVKGTPSAILIDSNGDVISSLAVGASCIVSLAAKGVDHRK